MVNPNKYKPLREELDDLLYSMEVPRIYFHALGELNRFLANHRKDWKEVKRAFEIIHEITPAPLPHYSKEISFDNSTDNASILSSEVE